MTFGELEMAVVAMISLATLRLALPILIMFLLNLICCRVLGLQLEPA